MGKIVACFTIFSLFLFIIEIREEADPAAPLARQKRIPHFLLQWQTIVSKNLHLSLHSCNQAIKVTWIFAEYTSVPGFCLFMDFSSKVFWLLNLHRIKRINLGLAQAMD